MVKPREIIDSGSDIDNFFDGIGRILCGRFNLNDIFEEIKSYCDSHSNIVYNNKTYSIPEITHRSFNNKWANINLSIRSRIEELYKRNKNGSRIHAVSIFMFYYLFDNYNSNYGIYGMRPIRYKFLLYDNYTIEIINNQTVRSFAII